MVFLVVTRCDASVQSLRWIVESTRGNTFIIDRPENFIERCLISREFAVPAGRGSRSIHNLQDPLGIRGSKNLDVNSVTVLGDGLLKRRIDKFNVFCHGVLDVFWRRLNFITDTYCHNCLKGGASAADAVKHGAEATANGIHHVTSFVARNDGRVADGTEAVTRAVGVGLNKAGHGLSAAGQQASKSLHGNASRVVDSVRNAIAGSGQTGGWRKTAGGLGWIATKLVAHAVGLTADAVNLVGKASTITGRLTEKSAPALGGSVGGVVRGAAEMTSNAVDAAALPASSIESMRAQLRSLGQIDLERAQSHLRAIESAKKHRRKDELLVLLVVGGMTLAQVLRDPTSVPADIEKAFEMAYPGLAQSETFSDAVGRF
jgi:hypothetical protein